MVKKYKVEKNLEGVIVIITGASSGIGITTTKALYEAGAHVIMACRNKEKTDKVIQGLTKPEAKGKLEYIEFDSSDLKKVESFVESFKSKNLPLHLLINNAGIAGGEKNILKEGYELTFYTNHLGHFYLTQLLLPLMYETAKNIPPVLKTLRIINVSSIAHNIPKKLDFDSFKQPMKGVLGMSSYGASKLCNVLFTLSLAKKLKQDNMDDKINTFSLHPGVVKTDIWRNVPSLLQPVIKFFMISEEVGSYTTLFCSLNDDILDKNGEFFSDCKVAKMSPLATQTELQDKLWSFSEEAVKEITGK